MTDAPLPTEAQMQEWQRDTATANKFCLGLVERHARDEARLNLIRTAVPALLSANATLQQRLDESDADHWRMKAEGLAKANDGWKEANATLTRQVEEAGRMRDELSDVLRDTRANLRVEFNRRESAEERVRRLEEAAKRAEKVLRPIADCVFNDNGDMTVTNSRQPTYTESVNAYFAHRELRATLNQPARTDAQR